MNANKSVHTVYYDGACRLCRGEMELLMQRNAAGLLAFVDIAAPGFDPTLLGPDLDAMSSLMHVRTPNGTWLVGIPAFEVIYAATGFTRVARWLRRPWVARFAARAYPWVVRNRYRLPHALVHGFLRAQDRAHPLPCTDGSCSLR
ncbi:thiol-disulfide oxidoreductase DCC family protein [Roseateles sp.]|uniref:thiol-disulfide oxidoreductase DCC family protein n=1 Tax=Roseateles sp. TaxID=1971397 RepID=UPI0039EC85CC